MSASPMRTNRFLLVTLFAILMAGSVEFGWAQTCAPIPGGLVGWWPGDDNTHDLRGGLDGTLTNGAAYGTGHVESAFQFAGSNDYVDTAATTWGFSTSTTVAAWINTTDSDGAVFSLAHDSVEDEMLLMVVGGKIAIFNHKFGGNFVGRSSDTAVNTGSWVFVAGILNGGGAAGNLEIYVNGIQEPGTSLSAGTSSDIVDTTPRSVRIGWRTSVQPSEHFVGAIDEVMLFDRVLSAAELEAISDAGPSGVCKRDHFLCYKAKLAKGQPKFEVGSKTLTDQFETMSFSVKKIVSICNPVDKNGEGIAFPEIHEQGFSIKASKGSPKLVASDHVTVDQFGTRRLTVKARTSLLDVTPKVLGDTPPVAFAADPTSDASVNRFKCYKASLAKGEPKFVPPTPPVVTDQFFTSGQAINIKKVTKLCTPTDMDGATPGAGNRLGHLVCYQVALPKGSAKFTARTVATNPTSFGADVLVATGLAELCVPALEDPAP